MADERRPEGNGRRLETSRRQRPSEPEWPLRKTRPARSSAKHTLLGLPARQVPWGELAGWRASPTGRAWKRMAAY